MEYLLSVKVVGRLTIDCEDSYAEGISEGLDVLQSLQWINTTTAVSSLSLMNSHFSYSRRSIELLNV